MKGLTCPCGRPVRGEFVFVQGFGPADEASVVGVNLAHDDYLCKWRSHYNGPHTPRRIWRRDSW
jgi:hypothetical protein